MINRVVKNLVLGGALCIVGVAAQAPALAQGPMGRISKHGMAARGHSMADKGNAWAKSRASNQAWHGQYYYVQYGQPTALVVPPNAIMQQNYSWGVSQNTMTPIYHQYGLAAEPSAGGAFYGTPRWPSNTRQFGVYPVRAPW